MELLELFNAVREENLNKGELENYRDELAHLYALHQIEVARIKKEKAFFLIKEKEKTAIATQNKWAVTDLGQKEIQLTYECTAIKEVLSSVKHRLYAGY